MEKSNNKGALVIGILIGIIIVLLVGIGLFATNIISFGDKSQSTNTTTDEDVSQEDNSDDDNMDFNSFLSSVSGSLGHLVVIHTLPQYGERKNNDYLKNVDDRQTFVMEYILTDASSEKNFVKINGSNNQKDDSLDVRHETTIAYYPYNLFNNEYKLLFGEDFKAAERITSVGGTNEYDESENYVYYINRRAGFNGFNVSDMSVEKTIYDDTNNSYTATVNMTYSDRLSENLGVKSEKAEIVYSVSNSSIILKSFIIK